MAPLLLGDLAPEAQPLLISQPPSPRNAAGSGSAAPAFAAGQSNGPAATAAAPAGKAAPAAPSADAFPVAYPATGCAHPPPLQVTAGHPAHQLPAPTYAYPQYYQMTPAGLVPVVVVQQQPASIISRQLIYFIIGWFFPGFWLAGAIRGLFKGLHASSTVHAPQERGFWCANVGMSCIIFLAVLGMLITGDAQD